jgi:MinD superfamily P-loop ATPase
MVKELVIASGKGGTGKTSISAALAALAPAKLLADCDVDAANLHLVVGSRLKEAHDFLAGFAPAVDEKACLHCGRCTNLCRFGAIEDGVISRPLACEGCGVCAFNCPAHAISMVDKKAGQWLVSDTRHGLLVHAELGLAVDNSGKLVSEVRRQAKSRAEKRRLPLIITDGPPGIGCPTIAALTGANLVLAVTEPSLSGIHDLERLFFLCRHFGVPVAVCINKADISVENTRAIVALCNRERASVVGEIPYDDAFREAALTGRTVMETGSGALTGEIRRLWLAVAGLLGVGPGGAAACGLDRYIDRFEGRRGMP